MFFGGLGGHAPAAPRTPAGPGRRDLARHHAGRRGLRRDEGSHRHARAPLHHVRRFGLRAGDLADDLRRVRRRRGRATGAQLDPRPDGHLDALLALQRHGLAHRLAVRRLSRRRTPQRDDDVDDPGAGRCRGRLHHAPERPRSGRTARRSERSTLRAPARARTTVASSVTATTCTTRPTSPSPRPSSARRSKCRRCATTATLDVAAGSANGTVHRLRHQGVEHLHGRGRGDLYVHLVVDVPTELDDTSEDLLRQLAEHRHESVLEESGGLFRRRKAKK